MPNFIDKLAPAVVDQIQNMANKSKRRSPRPYTKRLKDSRRIIPTVELPTGPTPEDPWCDPEEEDYVPLIGEAVKQYATEHRHRTSMTQYQADRSIASFLTFNRLHENDPIFVIRREHCKAWRTSLIESMKRPADPANRNKRVAGAVTIDKRIRLVNHWPLWCTRMEWLAESPMRDLALPQRLVAAGKVQKTSFSDDELAKIIPALLKLPQDDLPRTEFKWCALALLLSGARCMEIQQLRFKDIRQVEGYWVFDINKTDKGNEGEEYTISQAASNPQPAHRTWVS